MENISNDLYIELSNSLWYCFGSITNSLVYRVFIYDASFPHHRTVKQILQGMTV